MPYDLIIRNAMVVDGSGSEAYPADVAVRGARIARIGDPGDQAALATIDAGGRVVCPGFVDAHSHADLALVAGSVEQEKLRMGVTTEIIGHCGFSAFPVSDAHRKERRNSMAGFLPGVFLDWDWQDLDQYRHRVATRGSSTNFVPLVGHGSVRMAVMGSRADSPSDAEIEKMCDLVRGAMEAGATGFSSGLIYPPACYAATEELEALAAAAAEYDGIYVTHVRGETAPLIDAAIAEALSVAAAAKIPLQISHLKVIGLFSDAAGKIHDILARIEDAKQNGINVSYDCYPYTRGSTVLSALMPPNAMKEGIAGLQRQLSTAEGRRRIRSAVESEDSWENWVLSCGWDAIRIASVTKGDRADIVGQSISEIASQRGQHPFDTLADILLAEGAQAIMVFDMMRERDMLAALIHPLGMVGTDAIPCPPGQGHPHPRGYGTFAEILGRWVRERQLLTLESAVRKMAAVPAERFRLQNRGRVAEGYYADLVIFDPLIIAAGATFESPRQPPKGIEYVIVNGKVALSKGKPTGERPGRFVKQSAS